MLFFSSPSQVLFTQVKKLSITKNMMGKKMSNNDLVQQRNHGFATLTFPRIRNNHVIFP